jgi:periplasmic protein TonB
MSYKALLFCPDERTGRTVTQVLSELDFGVEPCNEPFAAVKKLTTEHFDAIVVDCENEQNAILLFKSARNSGSNQASLSIAVVEGQAGVAKAFRIGANLVLTKPINVEQSKGTIRVARGLLRKSESAKAAAPPTVEQPSRPVSSVPSSLAEVSASPSSSIFELEAEPEAKPEPTEAALLESMPDPSVSMGRGAVADSSSGSPWQPISKPMATALRDAAGATGHSEAAASPDSAVRSGLESSVSAVGAAAAPAREKPAAAEERTHEIEPPTFATSIGKPRRVPSAEPGRSGKTILIAAVILVVAAAGYFGWKKTHYRFSLSFLHESAAPAQAVHHPEAPVPPAPLPTQNPEPTAVATPAPSQLNTDVRPALPAPVHEEISASNGAPASRPKKAVSAIASSDIDAPAPKANVTVEPTAPAAIVVKRGAEKPVEPPATSEAAPEPNAPGALSVAADSKNEPIAGLVDVSPSVPRTAPQTLKVSQGVSQGLLMKKVAPVYPQQALQMKIQGAVQLVATISKDGNISDVKLLSGDAILGRAAIEAVKQWKYKPYLLDSQPVEIRTQITVNFKLP